MQGIGGRGAAPISCGPSPEPLLLPPPQQVACGRCGADGILTIASEAVGGGGAGGGKGAAAKAFQASGECEACHTSWSALARPR